MMNLLISIFSKVQGDFTEIKHLKRMETFATLTLDTYELMHGLNIGKTKTDAEIAVKTPATFLVYVKEAKNKLFDRAIDEEEENQQDEPFSFD